jgi:hypothetical protein
VRILEVLAHGEQPVGVIAAAVDSPQSTVSTHLQVLYHAGLVEHRRSASAVIDTITDARSAGLVPVSRNAAPHRARGIEPVMSYGCFTPLRNPRTPRPSDGGAPPVTTVMLVRDAHTSAVGHYLAGRTWDIELSDRGCAQLAELAAALRSTRLDAIHMSRWRAPSRPPARSREAAAFP